MTPHTYFKTLFAFRLPVYLGNMRTTGCLKYLDSHPVCTSVVLDLRPVWTIKEYRKGYREGAIEPN